MVGLVGCKDSLGWGGSVAHNSRIRVPFFNRIRPVADGSAGRLFEEVVRLESWKGDFFESSRGPLIHPHPLHNSLTTNTLLFLVLSSAAEEEHETEDAKSKQ